MEKNKSKFFFSFFNVSCSIKEHSQLGSFFFFCQILANPKTWFIELIKLFKFDFKNYFNSFIYKSQMKKKKYIYIYIYIKI